jgi:hypothetical protein
MLTNWKSILLRMKRMALLLGVLAGVIAIGAVALWQSHRKQERYCQTNMGMLYSAAVAHCLDQKLSPNMTLSVQVLAVYLRPDGTACPAGGGRYPDFSVLNGPVCPNGHRFPAGQPFPLRAPADSMLAGLYRAYGFTNLIENEAGPRGPATGSRPFRAETNQPPTAAGSRR